MSRYKKLSNLRLMAAAGAAIAVVLGAAGCTTAHQPVAAVVAVPTATTSAAPTPTATPAPARLTFTASVTRRHPFVGNKAGVFVSTMPGARITVVAHLETGDRKKTARADDSGLHTFWFPTGSLPSGYRVDVDIRVSANGQSRSSRTWFTPHLRPPPPPAPAPTAAPPATAAPPPAPSGCFPKASTGNCYEPGEFCPHADAGMRGVAGDGKDILCEDNNGLRWEPV